MYLYSFDVTITHFVTNSKYNNIQEKNTNTVVQHW